MSLQLQLLAIPLLRHPRRLMSRGRDGKLPAVLPLIPLLHLLPHSVTARFSCPVPQLHRGHIALDDVTVHITKHQVRMGTEVGRLTERDEAERLPEMGEHIRFSGRRNPAVSYEDWVSVLQFRQHSPVSRWTLLTCSPYRVTMPPDTSSRRWISSSTELFLPLFDPDLTDPRDEDLVNGTADRPGRCGVLVRRIEGNAPDPAEARARAIATEVAGVGGGDGERLVKEDS